MLLRPATEKVPGSQTQVFRDEQPEADQIAGDAIGEGLADPQLDRGGISGPLAALRLAGMGFDGCGNLWATLIEFFF